MENTDSEAVIKNLPDALKLNIAQQFLGALQNKNWDLLHDTITDDVSWGMPGNSVLISGKIYGAEAVIRRAKVIAGFGTSFTLNHFLISLNGVALSVRKQAQRNGIVLDDYRMIVLNITGGKVSAINTFASDIAGIDSFFSLKNMDLREPVEEPAPPALPAGYNDDIKHQLATTFVSALKNNDWDLMRSIMSPQLIWTLPGASLLSGSAYGVEAVIKRAQSLKQFGVMFNLKHILYGMNGFTLSLHNTSKRDELILDEYVAIVFDVADGKIQGMVTHLSDVPNIEEFFVPGIID